MLKNGRIGERRLKTAAHAAASGKFYPRAPCRKHAPATAAAFHAAFRSDFFTAAEVGGPYSSNGRAGFKNWPVAASARDSSEKTVDVAATLGKARISPGGAATDDTAFHLQLGDSFPVTPRHIIVPGLQKRRVFANFRIP